MPTVPQGTITIFARCTVTSWITCSRGLPSWSGRWPATGGWEDRAYYKLVEMLLQAGVDPRPVIEEALRQFPGHLPLRTIEALESLVVPGGGNVELGLVLPAYRY